MGATVVGVFVRQGGTWQRANGGTPTGFSGPQVRDGGLWRNCLTVETYQSGWKICWVNIDGELSVGEYSRSDFDISPYSVAAGVQFTPDGDVETRVLGGSWTDTGSNWRIYDCGRDYEFYSEYDSGPTGDIVAEPTRDTWLNFTSTSTTHTYEKSDSGTGFLNSRTDWSIRIRESVSAPSAGNDTGTVWIRLDAEV